MFDLVARVKQLKTASQAWQADGFSGRTLENDLIDLYREIKIKNDALEAKRADNPEALLQHDPALQILEDKFHAIWQSLPNQQRRQVVDTLTKAGLLPEFVIKAIDFFGGEIKSMVGQR